RTSPPPGNRTRPCGFEGRRASATPAGKQPSALARSRAWSSSFGAPRAVRHAKGAIKADGRTRTGMNLLTRQGPHRSATSTGAGTQGLEPASGRAGESNPDSLVASRESFRETSRPFVRRNPEVRPRIELGPPPYQGGVLPEHLQTGRLR